MDAGIEPRTIAVRRSDYSDRSQPVIEKSHGGKKLNKLRLQLQINRTKHQRSELQRATDQLLYRSTKTGLCIEHYTNKYAPQINCSTYQQI